MHKARQSLAPVNSSNSRASIAHGRQSIAPNKHGRPSMAPGAGDDRRSRGMSMGGRQSLAPNGGGQKIGDPREIKSNVFRERSVRKLLEYLVENSYDRPLNAQLISANTITLKEFVHIISFLFRAAIPNFEFGPKFEEEVPKVMKELGYKFMIQKAHLQTVGAQHAWPHLLAALVWLVDLLNYASKADKAESGGHDSFESADDGQKLFLDYLQRGYGRFLAGEDDLSDLEEQIALTFDAKNASHKADIAALNDSNTDLAEQVARLTEGETPLQQVTAHNNNLKSDEEKFGKHITDLHQHRGKMNEKLASAQHEASSIQASLDAVTAEVSTLKAVVAAQEITAADVSHMNAESEHLKTELAALAARKDELSQQLWDEETKVSRAVGRIEGKVQQSNTTCLRLHLIPKEAKNAHGVSHELALRKEALQNVEAGMEIEGVLSLDTSAVLRPGLLRVKSAVKAEVGDAQDLLLQSEKAAEVRAEEAAERVEQLSSLKASLAKLEREEKRLREEHAKELKEANAEAEALYERMRTARTENDASASASQAELTALQKEYDEFAQSAALARDRMYSQLVSTVDILTRHKDMMEKQLEGLKKHCDDKAQSLAPLLVDGAVELA